MVEAVSAMIGTSRFIVTTYNACTKLYSVLREMHTCGRNVILLFAELTGQYVIFEGIMRQDPQNLKDPWSILEEQHRTTQGILSQLTIIRRHLEKCVKLVERYLGKKDDPPSYVPTGGEPSESRERGQANLSDQNLMGGTLINLTGDSTTATSSLTHHQPSDSRSASVAKDKGKATRLHPDQAFQEQQHRNRFGNFDGESIRQKDPRVQEVHKKIGFFLRIWWTFADKETLTTSVDAIRRAVSALGQIVELKSPERSSELISQAPTEKKSQLEVDAKLISGALQRLQRALRKANQKCSEDSRWVLDIGISNHPRDEWEFVNDQYFDLPWRSEGLLFYLCKRPRSSPVRYPGFAIETPCNMGLQAEEDDRISQLESLEDADEATVRATDEEDLQLVGDLPDPRNGRDLHRLFRRHVSLSETRGLTDHMSTEGFIDRVSPVNLGKLAGNIVRWHLSLRSTRVNAPNPRLEHYVYHEEGLDWNPSQDLYLSCDFARVPSRVSSSAAREGAKHADAAILELGLVLYQLGSGKRVKYTPSSMLGLGSSLLEAKKRALDDLETLDRKFGPTYSRVVQTCLIGNAQDETEAITRCAVLLDCLVEHVQTLRL